MADILIIDDDPALRSVARRILERAGHVVREAEDGNAGLELMREREPDILITDLFMPGKEGIETIQEVNEAWPDVKILAISGGASVGPGGPLKDARAFGAADALPKPFSVDELQQRVQRLLDQD